ncbi:MAG: hypothetical protein U9N02_09570 [Campylobacterota bacterium]|nr:hypothetical protein [Campylobacterota bacterium]
MDIVLLIKSGLGLTVLLVILIYLLLLSFKKKKKPQKKKVKQTKQRTTYSTLEELRKIIKDRDIDSKKLEETLNEIIKYHGTMPKQIGVNVPAELYIFEDIIYIVCRHPSVTSTIILEFISQLEKLNHNYKYQINNALTKGLNSRVI